MQRRLATILCLMLTLGVLAFSTQRALTQDAGGNCPTLVKQALAAVGDSCGGLGRNSACYGFNRVNATFGADVTDGFFSKPADQSNLKLLTSIDTAPLNESLKEWGVAVMSVQANIPNSLPGQAISFVLLGDVTVDNAVPADQAVSPAETPINVKTLGQSNIRTLPTTNSNVIGSVSTGTVLGADAINPNKDWLRVVFNNHTPGWINRNLVELETEGDLDSLPVFANDSKTPMQAFYFKTGIGAPSCNKAPDVLVVQGPDKVAVDISANGANIRIGSTIALRSIEGNKMQVITIHGEAKINGVIVPIGYVTTVQLSDDGKTVIGEPEPPRQLTQEELDELQWLDLIPGDILNYPIDVPTNANSEPTPEPSDSGGKTGTTAVVNCRPFKATSPLDGLNYGMNTFYWDAAPGATSYRVNVQGAGSQDVDAPTTNLSFDISAAGFNPQLSWSVEALYKGVVVCHTPTITIPRKWAPDPVTPQPGFYAQAVCGGSDFTIYWGNVPVGTSSLTINFDTSNAEPDPFPPITISPPPTSGSQSIAAFTSFFSVFSGSVVANPSGATANFSPIFCSSGGL